MRLTSGVESRSKARLRRPPARQMLGHFGRRLRSRCSRPKCCRWRNPAHEARVAANKRAMVLACGHSHRDRFQRPLAERIAARGESEARKLSSAVHRPSAQPSHRDPSSAQRHLASRHCAPQGSTELRAASTAAPRGLAPSSDRALADRPTRTARRILHSTSFRLSRRAGALRSYCGGPTHRCSNASLENYPALSRRNLSQADCKRPHRGHPSRRSGLPPLADPPDFIDRRLVDRGLCAQGQAGGTSSPPVRWSACSRRCCSHRCAERT